MDCIQFSQEMFQQLDLGLVRTVMNVCVL